MLKTRKMITFFFSNNHCWIPGGMMFIIMLINPPGLDLEDLLK